VGFVLRRDRKLRTELTHCAHRKRKVRGGGALVTKVFHLGAKIVDHLLDPGLLDPGDSTMESLDGALLFRDH
jgi:hypothetical protein